MEEKLSEKLMMKKEKGWLSRNDEEREQIFKFSDGYIHYLNIAKTEREAVIFAKVVAEKNGYRDINTIERLQPGDKVYYVNRDKSIYLAIIGTEKLENGLHIIGSHIDSPRLDLKPTPLYEDTEFAYFKTHYYGGIKKYQWTAIPLAIHGVIVTSNGNIIDINIGEHEKDPIFTITDLLPHLAQEQNKKTLDEGISGEELNLLIGSIPYQDEKIKEKVKLNILNILNKQYGITERDFISSELELVPAFKAKSLGFDASMVAGYGQDDRSCAYTALRALTSTSNLKKTAIMLLSDKEEIGSMGNTGMESRIFESFVAELLNKANEKSFDILNRTFSNSKMLSADVTSASDPTYISVDEKYNAAYLGKGVVLSKYTGSKGKSGANDANAEFIAYIRKIFETSNLMYQMSDMGKVDEGGGGTIAYILANKGIDVIDCGLSVLSMHSPYEVTSKFDIYNTYECYKTFYERA